MSEPTLPGNPSLPSTVDQIQLLIEKDSRDHQYSVEDFFKIPEKSNFKISPDGAHISYVGPHERRRNVFVQNRASGQLQRVTNELARDIGGYAWANSQRLIYIKDSGGDENFKLFAVDKDGSNLLDLTPFDKVRIQIIDPLRDQDEFMIIGMNKNNPMLFDPYRININTGELTQLATNDNPQEPLESWMCDNEGKLRICSKTKNGVNHAIMYRDTEEDAFEEIITTNFKDQLVPVHFDQQNSHVLYCISNLDRDKSVLIKYDMHDKAEVGEAILANDTYDIGSMQWSRKKEKMVSASYTSWKTEIVYFDEESKALAAKWQELFPDKEVRAVSMNTEEDIFIIRTFSDRSLGAYYLYELETELCQKIIDVSPWLDEDQLSDMKPISYTTRDGVEINGYLTLPKQAEPGQALPLVVNPHGGPWVRDSWGYNPEVQLLASRGYAVFQMNYRSSTGYGKAFWELGFKQWGKTMQDDITDGVNYLIAEGIASKEQVAIYGGSYGGYATLAGICYTPDLYVCAVDFVGVSNLFTFMNTIPPYWKPYLDMLHEMVGHPEDDKAYMEESSPAFHVDKIKTPLFVVQGANDPRVNIDESDQIVSSLRKRGIDVPYLVKYDEGHGFANEENKFEFYKAMLGFLYQYLN